MVKKARVIINNRANEQEHTWKGWRKMSSMRISKERGGFPAHACKKGKNEPKMVGKKRK
jgi:hypothetical protein